MTLNWSDNYWIKETSDFKEGDKVIITRKPFNFNKSVWVSQMDKSVGEIGYVTHVDKKTGTAHVVTDKAGGWWYPVFVLRKVIG
jgi:hypothetical protein